MLQSQAAASDCIYIFVGACALQAPGVLAMEQPANDCERGHFFVRVLLHRRIRSTFSSYCGSTYTSHLHIVDLLVSLSIRLS